MKPRHTFSIGAALILFSSLVVATNASDAGGPIFWLFPVLFIATAGGSLCAKSITQHLNYARSLVVRILGITAGGIVGYWFVLAVWAATTVGDLLPLMWHQAPIALGAALVAAILSEIVRLLKTVPSVFG